MAMAGRGGVFSIYFHLLSTRLPRSFFCQRRDSFHPFFEGGCLENHKGDYQTHWFPNPDTPSRSLLPRLNHQRAGQSCIQLYLHWHKYRGCETGCRSQDSQPSFDIPFLKLLDIIPYRKTYPYWGLHFVYERYISRGLLSALKILVHQQQRREISADDNIMFPNISLIPRQLNNV